MNNESPLVQTGVTRYPGAGFSKKSKGTLSLYTDRIIFKPDTKEPEQIIQKTEIQRLLLDMESGHGAAYPHIAIFLKDKPNDALHYIHTTFRLAPYKKWEGIMKAWDVGAQSAKYPLDSNYRLVAAAANVKQITAIAGIALAVIFLLIGLSRR